MKAQLALKKVFSVCHRHTDSIREGWKHILEVVLALFKGHLLPKVLKNFFLFVRLVIWVFFHCFLPFISHLLKLMTFVRQLVKYL